MLPGLSSHNFCFNILSVGLELENTMKARVQHLVESMPQRTKAFLKEKGVQPGITSLFLKFSGLSYSLVGPLSSPSCWFLTHSAVHLFFKYLVPCKYNQSINSYLSTELFLVAWVQIDAEIECFLGGQHQEELSLESNQDIQKCSSLGR